MKCVHSTSPSSRVWSLKGHVGCRSCGNSSLSPLRMRPAWDRAGSADLPCFRVSWAFELDALPPCFLSRSASRDATSLGQ